MFQPKKRRVMRAKFCVLELHRKIPQRFPLPEIVGLLELDWSEKLQEWRQTLGREFWCLRRPVAVFFDDRFIGSDIELIKLMTIGNILMENIPRKNMSSMKKNFREDYMSYLRKTKRTYCYLDICVDEVYEGTLTFQLYSDILPRTCENFKTLCLGTRGPLLSYRGSRIHRIVKQGWLQGGDIQYKTGGGGFSIFCDPLEDECFGISHDRRGVLSMASGGRHANGSQFFVTLKPSKWMDTHFVAFGQLVEGVRVLKLLENLETAYECPLKRVEIKSCGKLDLQDVEDVDAMYAEEPLPAKKEKKFETISEQVVRLILEALTEALKRKERAPDILDDGDVPSKMNLQLYFQGFYSLPESVLEDTAMYLRNLRRQLLRVMKPSATEIVEVLMYDLQMAVLTRMTTLDDVRETVGHDLYQKMISGINLNLELCQKAYVRRFVDQVISTAESIVNLVSKKLQKMKKMSKNLKKFQDGMQAWVQSFVLQETFKGDNYFIAQRPYNPEKPAEVEKMYLKRGGRQCCEEERKKKEEELKAKLRAKYGPEDLCCLGSKLHLSESVINLYDFFGTCRYDLKRVPKNEKERMPLLDLIEISRFKLKWIRKHENRVKGEERLCLEKKIRKWMSEVAYTAETSWMKEAVFPRDCLVHDHMEEILYGAMTVGLLEMYYFMEEYMKLCGGKKKKLVTRTIYPEVSDEEVVPLAKEKEKEEEEEEEEEEEGEGGLRLQSQVEEELIPCSCGHPCCVCPPRLKPPPTPPPSLEGEGEIDGLEDLKEPPPPPLPPVKPCASDETLVDLNAILAESLSIHPEEIDIKSFRWLKPYILEKSCDLKTEFATQVHKWLEGDRFSYKGFLSKHSLGTRASLLSLSLSLAELIKEENNLKTEIKNFIYDLWDLYFEEMFKEALLEHPQESPEEKEKKEEEEKREGKEGEMEEGKEQVSDLDDECKKLMEQTLPFDFEKFCREHGHEGKVEDDEVAEDVMPVPVQEPEQPKTYAEPKQTQPEPEPREEPIVEVPPEPAPNEPVDEPVTSETDESAGYQDVEPLREFIPADDAMEDVGGRGDAVAVKEPKKKMSPIVIEELVDVSSGEEIREMPPYVLPFWVKFLTELTKQALGAIAKVSRLPRRLYFQSDSEMAFDDKMKDWFEFNAFNPQPTKGREIKDYIALNHRSLTSLEDTARSYLKKKKYSELLNRCTRFASADDMAKEIVADVLDTAMGKTEHDETLELFFSNFVSSAITSAPGENPSEEEDEDIPSLDTDKQDSFSFTKEEEEEGVENGGRTEEEND